MRLNILDHNPQHVKGVMQWLLIILVLVLLLAAYCISPVLFGDRTDAEQDSHDTSFEPLLHSQSPGSKMEVAGSEMQSAIDSQADQAGQAGLTTATLVIVGDIMLGRQVNIEMVKQDDFTWPFHQTIDMLKDADLTLGNLESPMVSGCPIADTGMLFCARPRAVEGLVWADIDGVSLANNHAHTYGEPGFEETVDILLEAGIDPVTADRLMVRDIAGIRIGVLGFEDSETALDLDQAVATIRESSSQVDVLIGLIHWGVEYQTGPNERQQEVGHALIDAGMDIVVGAHPHLIQPIETYNDKLIFYSLGNFIFDQMWWQETRIGAVIRLEIAKNWDDITIDYEMNRVEIHDYGQPTIVE
ncbi:MAG: CapA family protein [Anaerolineae bacterium]|nr:CapA family protein [Anaerolineae bacterium]